MTNENVNEGKSKTTKSSTNSCKKVEVLSNENTNKHRKPNPNNLQLLPEDDLSNFVRFSENATEEEKIKLSQKISKKS